MNMKMSTQSQVWRQLIRFMFRNKNLSIQEERARSQTMTRFHPPYPPTVELSYGSIPRNQVDEMSTAFLRPAGAAPGPVLLYMHGGGYVTGSIASSLMISMPLAEALSIPLFAFDYRLAPEYPYPAALEDALLAYHWLLSQGYNAQDIILLGDSAGGGLALATAMALRDEGEPLPAGLVLFSPWTDLTNTSPSHTAHANRDVMLTTAQLNRWAEAYAGDTPRDEPYISPRFGTFTGLPPLLIQVDESEILLDDSHSVADAARSAGVDVSLIVWQGLWHVWPAVGPMLPETLAAYEEISTFLKKLGRKDS